MYVYIYIYIYTYIQKCITYTYRQKNIYVYMYICTCMHAYLAYKAKTCMHPCMHAHLLTLLSLGNLRPCFTAPSEVQWFKTNVAR